MCCSTLPHRLYRMIRELGKGKAKKEGKKEIPLATEERHQKLQCGEKKTYEGPRLTSCSAPPGRRNIIEKERKNGRPGGLLGCGNPFPLGFQEAIPDVVFQVLYCKQRNFFRLAVSPAGQSPSTLHSLQRCSVHIYKCPTTSSTLATA